MEDDNGDSNLNQSMDNLQLINNQSVSTHDDNQDNHHLPPPSAINYAMIQSPSFSQTTASQLDNYLTDQIEKLDSNSPFQGLPKRENNARPTARIFSINNVAPTNTQVQPITIDSKRKRSESSSSIDKIAPPANPAPRNKLVTFDLHLQGNNNGNSSDGTTNNGTINNTDAPNQATDQDIPAQLNVEVGEADPARNYKVIPEAEKMWKLAMEELRLAARSHSRLTHVNHCLANSAPDLYLYGITPVPDYMQPYMKDILPKIHEQAMDLQQEVKMAIEKTLDLTQKQANRYMTNVKDTYEDVSNTDYPLAERRLLGITGHYRSKEKTTLEKILSEQITKRPNTQDEWLNTLTSRRSNQVARSRKRTRSNTRSPSRSASHDHKGSNPKQSTSKGTSSNNYKKQKGPRNQSSRGPPNRQHVQTHKKAEPHITPASMDEATMYAWFRQFKADAERAEKAADKKKSGRR